MKSFILAVMVVLGFAGVAAADHCNQRSVQRIVSGYSNYNDVLNVEIVNSHDQYYTARVEPVLEIQSVERIVVPQTVNYVAYPQKIRHVEQVRVVNQPVVVKRERIVVEQQNNYDYSSNSRQRVVIRNESQAVKALKNLNQRVRNLSQRVKNVGSNRNRNVQKIIIEDNRGGY